MTGFLFVASTRQLSIGPSVAGFKLIFWRAGVPSLPVSAGPRLQRSEGRISGGMKFKCTLSSMGVTWLERFVPIFEKMGKELSVLFTPETLHLVQGAADSGGLELHADLLVKEAFDEYRIASNNADKIAVKLETATLYRVLRGLVGSEATHVEVKLIKRVIREGLSLPFLNFASTGLVDITQDVPLGGPLNKRELEDLEHIVQANVVNVPYWLNLDRQATEGAHQAAERFKAVGPRTELATTKAGSLHLATAKGGSVTLGTEYRGLPVLPVAEDQYETAQGGVDDDDDAAGASERLAEAAASGSAALVAVNTKQLWKGLQGVQTNPSNAMIGVASNRGHMELVFRYDRQTVNGPDAVGLFVRVPAEIDEDFDFD